MIKNDSFPIDYKMIYKKIKGLSKSSCLLLLGTDYSKTIICPAYQVKNQIESKK